MTRKEKIELLKRQVEEAEANLREAAEAYSAAKRLLAAVESGKRI